MTLVDPQFLAVGSGAAQRRIAYLLGEGALADAPGLVWLPGFRSEMTSTKASDLAAFAGELGVAMTRFDYSGHGQSGGDFLEGTIGRWLEETRAVFQALTRGPQIVVGSSMGGYLALLLLRALLREAPGDAGRIKAMVLIAPAWDMTDRLMPDRLSDADRRELMERGVYMRPSRYGDGPYPITRRLIEEGQNHLIGSAAFDPGRPIHILHGLEDPDVPWEHTLDLVSHLTGDWTKVSAVPDGEHRLSRPQDLALLRSIIGEYLPLLRA
ncbi:MAG: alpha/beta hydrolase [Hyphomicrobiaceae bacterium]